MSVNEKMTAIANAIRDKTGGTDALTLDGMAESIPKVYEAGKYDERKRFWDNYLLSDNWSRKFYGTGWNDETFRPTKDLIVKGSASDLFRGSHITSITDCLKYGTGENDNFILDLSEATNPTFSFGYTKLRKISIKIGEKFTFHMTSFFSSPHITDLQIVGTLATNGLNLAECTNLNRESLLSIIDCLKDYFTDTSGTTWAVTLGTENLAKLTDAEKAVATQKGWTLV